MREIPVLSSQRVLIPMRGRPDADAARIQYRAALLFLAGLFLPLADGVDVIKFDPGLGRIYVACYSGALSVFHQDDPDHYRKLEDFRVQHAVHSLAVDPKTHRVYTPEQEEDGKPVARMVVYEAVTGP